MRRIHWIGSLVASVVFIGACQAGSTNDVFATGGSGGSSKLASATGSGDGSGAADATGTTAAFMTGSAGTGANTCNSGPDEDKDHDGWTVTQGDCNDCDPNVNPGALEVIVTTPDPMTGMVPPPADEDCDGTADNPPPETCDTGLALDSNVAMDGAKAIELCKVANGPKDWGVVTAAYVRADGSPAAPSLQYGIMPNFGPNVPTRKGASLLGISSGHARLPSEPGSCGSLSCYGYGAGTPPPGYPQNSGTCPISSVINDDIGLDVHLRAPSNATGYKFDFKFYSFEYPEWVCTDYNDQFMALVTPAPMGALNGNISFDSQHDPVSVNVAFFNVCAGCAQGTAELTGTGFDIWNDAGATQWLETLAPIKGGDEFDIRMAIWDTGDQAWDSTALVDNFQWIANGGTVVVGTNPVN